MAETLTGPPPEIEYGDSLAKTLPDDIPLIADWYGRLLEQPEITEPLESLLTKLNSLDQIKAVSLCTGVDNEEAGSGKLLEITGWSNSTKIAGKMDDFFVEFEEFLRKTNLNLSILTNWGSVGRKDVNSSEFEEEFIHEILDNSPLSMGLGPDMSHLILARKPSPDNP